MKLIILNGILLVYFLPLVLMISQQKSPVYSIAFSPDGEYLASGSFDKSIYIWSVKTGNVVRSYQDTAGIFEVSWSPNGDKIAGAFADHKIAILDFRM
ncbi:f-box-like/wd repeat-containing protein tbl1xr1 isoform x1 [Anaeramoeba ignava]|uniref:F-box-like/wd repeat-containing protein tbl1xr1 isoform x1 n=1 Tax=Anaeramoeba ignava TaxID=1746090 RepID=A0A9Q0LHB5_ANAIG|nr:f-box-like/wd repeat-containing protein tbl1xr1 isoform x1 [Anaeramoeba ignava]